MICFIAQSKMKMKIIFDEIHYESFFLTGSSFENDIRRLRFVLNEVKGQISSLNGFTIT